jgi:hypothetical protein
MGSVQTDGDDIKKAIRYEIVGDVNTFRCELEEERKIMIKYYHGKAFIDGEHEVDVTFIVQILDLELVIICYTFAYETNFVAKFGKLKHPTVLLSPIPGCVRVIDYRPGTWME